MTAPTYPECLCRTCGCTFTDVGWAAHFPGPAYCFNCQDNAKRAAKGRRRTR